MSDLIIREDGIAGRITLNRPKALNALTWDMLLDIEQALDAWRDDDGVQLVILDAAGEKAFCAGGDIAEMYATGMAGDYDYGQRFWTDEYRLNAKMYHYPKPLVSFLHGFTMGGGVGVGCHGSHRIVGETSRIAMPEVGIGLVPDVGGSLILAKAPGFLGEYLGLTADRMDAGDAIYAGFADTFVPEATWDDVKTTLCAGDIDAIARAAQGAPAGRLIGMQARIDETFGAADLKVLDAATKDWPEVRKMLDRNAPLSLAVSLRLIRAVRADPTIETALVHEYRFTARSMAQGDFLEGIRAAIIDRDRTPKWRHASWADVTETEVARMTAPMEDET